MQSTANEEIRGGNIATKQTNKSKIWWARTSEVGARALERRRGGSSLLCHGGGGGMNCWAPPQPQPMCCPGPSLCRGCNGCKIVRETKFSYEEYPSSACAIM